MSLISNTRPDLASKTLVYRAIALLLCLRLCCVCQALGELEQRLRCSLGLLVINMSNRTPHESAWRAHIAQCPPTCSFISFAFGWSRQTPTEQISVIVELHGTGADLTISRTHSALSSSDEMNGSNALAFGSHGASPMYQCQLQMEKANDGVGQTQSCR